MLYFAKISQIGVLDNIVAKKCSIMLTAEGDLVFRLSMFFKR